MLMACATPGTQMPAATIAAASFLRQFVTFIRHFSALSYQNYIVSDTFNVMAPRPGAMIFRAEFLYFSGDRRQTDYAACRRLSRFLGFLDVKAHSTP
jgi:hypothetical protein